MKRILTVLLCAMMVGSFTACKKSSSGSSKKESSVSQAASPDSASPDKATADEPSPDEGSTPQMPVAGGFTDADSTVLPDEVKAQFDNAASTLTGAEYTPVAYVASQVVAGTNHLILCKATPTVPDANTTYALVTLYVDLNGGSEIINIQDSDAHAPAPVDPENPETGAFVEAESPEVTDDARQALSKANEEMTGAEYEAKALLATQVVAGTNYKMLCKITPVVPNAEAYYSIVTVYADLQGNASISAAVDFGDDADNAEAEPQSEASQA